jgi:hypothetical protein
MLPEDSHFGWTNFWGAAQTFVRTLRLLLVLGLAGLAGGCGQGSLSPTDQAKIGAKASARHGQIHKALNAAAKEKKEAMKGAGKRAAQRGRQ